jgi:methyl-accepting chemotaxis protein PixJ
MTIVNKKTNVNEHLISELENQNGDVNITNIANNEISSLNGNQK